MFEVWDRVTGRLCGEYASREEAEAHIPATFAEDFVVIEVDED